MPTLNIIGAGHLGKTLGRLWQQAGVFEVRQILNRSPQSADDAVKFIGAGVGLTDWNDLEPADITLIATPDSDIATVCATLARNGLVGSGQVVFHCSGALPSAALAAAAVAGAAVASVHPIKSFADPTGSVHTFAGTWCGIEGDHAALAVLEPACEAIGGRAVNIDAQFKTIYHAAAVFASNYLVTVLDVSVRAYEKAGIPPDTALKLIEPLVRGTVDNVFAIGTTAALSGPIARGDAGTAMRQYRALSAWDKQVGSLYKALAKPTAAIARRRRQRQP